MKSESTVKYVARLALTLLLITSVVAVALAGINKVTKPVIASLNEQKTQEAITAVLPGGGQPATFDAAANPLVQAVYEGESGYAVQVAPNGFNGEVSMMVGVGSDGSVLGISIIKQAETAGLGAVCADKTSAGEEFRGQFAGNSGSVSVTKDGGSIDAITGATITSRAVCSGVNAALACVAG